MLAADEAVVCAVVLAAALAVAWLCKLLAAATGMLVNPCGTSEPGAVNSPEALMLRACGAAMIDVETAPSLFPVAGRGGAVVLAAGAGGGGAEQGAVTVI